MAKKGTRDLTDLYNIAIDPSSSRKELKRVWEETKSVRIRKAIASNLNCDPDVMKIASRLYVKEVVTNPSFEVLKLFGEDPFVSNLFDAFDSPDVFSKKLGRSGGENELYAKAALLSPNLSSHASIEAIFTVLNISDIKREMKDVSTKDKVRKICLAGMGLSRISTGVVMDLYNSGVISLDELDSYLNSCRPGMFTSNTAGSIKRLLESQINSLDNSRYEMIFKLIVSCPPRLVGSIFKSALTVSGGDKYLPLVSNLYKDLLLFDLKKVRKSNSSNAPRRPYWYSPRGLCSSDASFQIWSASWKFLEKKHLGKSNSWDQEKILGLLGDLEVLGFMGEYSGYSPRLRVKKESETASSRLKLVETLLSIKSDQHFEFLASTLTKDLIFYSRAPEGSLDRALSKRLNSLNLSRFTKGDSLLFEKTEIDCSFPYCKVGLKDGYKIYGAHKSLPYFSQTPSGSGLIDVKIIDNFVDKA